MKKNFIAKELRTPKYKARIVKPKKGKGSFKRKKKIIYLYLISTLKLIIILSSFDKFSFTA